MRLREHEFPQETNGLSDDGKQKKPKEIKLFGMGRMGASITHARFTNEDDVVFCEQNMANDHDLEPDSVMLYWANTRKINKCPV